MESSYHNYSEMDIKTWDVCVIKSEPETVPEEESSISHCDAILQYGIVKEETEDASAIKWEPGTLAAEEHAQENHACSEIDIEYPDIKKECFAHQNKIIESRGKLLTYSSSVLLYGRLVYPADYKLE